MHRICFSFILLVIISVTGSEAQTNNVGIGTLNPGTSLDVKGGLTLRQDTVVFSQNNAQIPANSSQVVVTGYASNGSLTVTAPTPLNAGQVLTVINNEAFGKTISMNGYSIFGGRSLTFRSTDVTAASFAPDAPNSNMVSVRNLVTNGYSTGTSMDCLVTFFYPAATTYYLPSSQTSKGQILYFCVISTSSYASGIISGTILNTGSTTTTGSITLTSGQRTMLICDGNSWIRMY